LAQTFYGRTLLKSGAPIPHLSNRTHKNSDRIDVPSSSETGAPPKKNRMSSSNKYHSQKFPTYSSEWKQGFNKHLKIHWQNNQDHFTSLWFGPFLVAGFSIKPSLARSRSSSANQSSLTLLTLLNIAKHKWSSVGQIEVKLSQTKLPFQVVNTAKQRARSTLVHQVL